MSSALAIASVTAVMKDLLNNGLIDHNVASTVGNVSVTALAPDRVDEIQANNQSSHLNLFLYQVTPNTAWRNVALPSRDTRGDRVSNPPLALDLHYLLTAYGAFDLHAEILLGYGMQLLHETPVLTRNAIRTALAPPPVVGGGGGLPVELQSLATSELADQVEMVKISPETLNTEEISRLWTALQAHYRPTAAYQVTVVLIESKHATKTPLPVRERMIYTVPFQQPLILEIRSQKTSADPIVAGQPILAGHNLVLVGQRLRAEDVRVEIAEIETMPADADISDTQILVTVPASLLCGLHVVRVVHPRMMGSPPTPHRGVESNLAAFLLRPRLTSVTAANVQGAGSSPRSADVTVNVEPAVGDEQRVLLLLNRLASSSSPAEENASYSFSAPSRLPPSPLPGTPGTTNTLTIPIQGVKAGTYLVRLQVDGADSPLIDVGGQFVSPQVILP
ncbi:MAG: DUF4255 domain-containing protein [Candidatus Polarisedimenticolia bacterium]